MADDPSTQLASYSARPEENGPFLRFQVEAANSTLLGFVRRGGPGFEVLQIPRGKFKYHWHNDLVRAFEEEVPILSRYWAFVGERAVAVDHLAVPVIVRHRVREVRGWFTFAQDVTDDLRAGARPFVVRRPLQSRIVRLQHGPSPAMQADTTHKAGPGRARGRWRRTSRPANSATGSPTHNSVHQARRHHEPPH